MALSESNSDDFTLEEEDVHTRCKTSKTSGTRYCCGFEAVVEVTGK